MAKPIRIIKKYPNRRLYDTANSGYITLADVKQMVLEFIDFQVIDAKSGDDLTRSILLQIILEEESVGVPMLSRYPPVPTFFSMSFWPTLTTWKFIPKSFGTGRRNVPLWSLPSISLRIAWTFKLS